MRPFAAVVLLALSGCPGPNPLVARPVLSVSFIDSLGRPFSTASGDPMRLRNLSSACTPTDTIQIQNFGDATARFEVSAPSVHFGYERGPFELPPGAIRALDVRIDPSLDLPGDGRLLHEFRFDPLDRNTMDVHVFTLSAQVITPELTPSFDFGAVIVGENSTRSWNSTATVSGDFWIMGEELTFSPTQYGLQTRTVNWMTREECPPVMVSILGNGVSTLLAGEPAPIDFGTVPVGTTASRELEVAAWTNDLARFSTTSEGFAVDARPSASTPTSRTASQELQPARHTVTVRFTPSAPGLVTGKVQLLLADTVTTIIVTGTGTR